MSVYRPLRQSNKNITRSYNLIYLWNHICSICQCCNRLRTTNFENAVNACNISCNQGSCIYFTISSCRSSHDNIGNTCNLGRYYVHQCSGRICSFSTRNIYTNTVHGSNLLSKNRTVFLGIKPAVTFLFLMICTNIGSRSLHHFDKMCINLCIGFFYLSSGYFKGLFCKFTLVKFARVLKDSFFFAALYLFYDLCNDLLIFPIIIRTSF